jgi:DNA-binding transcriptional regulator YdaS (Cro superfamily)
MHLATVTPMSEAKKPGRPPNKTVLREWVNTKWAGDHVQLADALGIKISYLEKILSGTLQMSWDLAFRIEEFTRGEVKHTDLRKKNRAA